MASGALAQESAAPEASPAEAPKKTLDKIIVEGQKLELSTSEPGKMVFTPKLIAKVNGEGSRAQLHNSYTLVFTPVSLSGDGFVDRDVTRPDSSQFLHPFISVRRHGTVNGLIVREIEKYELEFTEEGLYALTSVHFRVPKKTWVGFNGYIDEVSGVRRSVPPDWLTTYSYCLAEGTLLFDVEIDKVNALGDLLIHGLTRDESSYAEHHPIIATEAPTEHVESTNLYLKSPDRTVWGVGRFETSMCPEDTDFVTSGWKLAEDWSW